MFWRVLGGLGALTFVIGGLDILSDLESCDVVTLSHSGGRAGTTTYTCLTDFEANALQRAGMIAEYNAGSLNIDEYLRRLIALSQSLTDEEQRAVAEGLTEEELAIFDLLTKPEPVLTDAELDVVKASAKRLLTELHEKLVLDWRRKASTAADVRSSIRRLLDADLPADPYPPEVFDAKVQAVFDHVATAYGDDGRSVCDGTTVEPVTPAGGVAVVPAGPVTAASLTEEVVEQLRHDAEFVALVAEKLGLTGRPELRTIDELIDNDEDYAVEFKSTARWDLRENQPSKGMEDAIVKTVAGFLSTDGGTLLIGIGPDRSVIGIAHDYERVKPKNGDGFVNWLTTHLINALGHTPVTRTRARIAVHQGTEICRVDVAASPVPVRAKTSKADGVFYCRMNNSTRELPESDAADYINDRWGSA